MGSWLSARWPRWLLLIAWLAASWVAAESLWCARPIREVIIQGTLKTGSPLPANQVQLDADLRLLPLRFKIKPGGQQFIALPPEGASDTWSRKVDSPASYSLNWQKDGEFELRLGLPMQSLPTAGRLTFRFLSGGELSTKFFLLTEAEGAGGPISGVAPPMVLDRLPAPARTEVPQPRGGPVVDSQGAEPSEPDVQESGSPSEEDEIRSKAESALLIINRISNRELRARYLLIDYLDSQPSQLPADARQRTRKIGILLKSILQRKMELHDILRAGEGSFTQLGADMGDLPLEEGVLSESD